MGWELVEAYTVFCDVPGCSSDVGLFWDREAAKDAARTGGWKEVKDDVFHCPDCRKKSKRKK